MKLELGPDVLNPSFVTIPTPKTAASSCDIADQITDSSGPTAAASETREIFRLGNTGWAKNGATIKRSNFFKRENAKKRDEHKNVKKF